MRTRKRLLLAVLPLALVITGLIGVSPATARTPRVPAGLGAIEGLAPYVAQVSCDPVVHTGTAKLMHLILTTYPGTTAASVYVCGTDGPVSEHYDGRAIDWMVSIHNAGQHAAANSFITWLLATDSKHNRFAMARRLGVQYIIFNNRMWGSWNGAWRPYNNCAKLPGAGNDNACHRTHMHISLSWNGAGSRSTFWSKHVLAFDYGPCRERGLNWADNHKGINTHWCPDYRTVAPPAHASATKVTLVTYSGARLQQGSRGPAVAALQRALHLAAGGYFGIQTYRAVVAFQRAHHLVGSGSLNPTTWRVLLAAVK